MKYKGLLSLLILCFLSFPAFGATVSFLMIETGLNGRNQAIQYGSLWEGGLMEAFFNAGFIVTNSPITRMENRPDNIQNEFEADLDEAFDGGAEFFILSFLEYEVQGNALVPQRIIIEIYSTVSRQLIMGQAFPAGRGRDVNEEYRLAVDAGSQIIPYLRNR